MKTFSQRHPWRHLGRAIRRAAACLILWPLPWIIPRSDVIALEHLFRLLLSLKLANDRELPPEFVKE